MLLNLMRSPVSWLLLALCVALCGWGWSASTAASAQGQVETLQGTLKTKEDEITVAATRERAKDGAIAGLNNELTAQASAAITLQSQLDTLAQTAAERTDTIRRLTRENDELRMWADRPLPAAVVRLLQRPALTGAAAYQAHLSSPATLPTAGRQPRQ